MTVDTLACDACMSKDHFIRLFRQETGDTPAQFIINSKMAKAKLMLASENMPIASTAVSSTGPETGQCILPISGATDSRRMFPGDSSICDVISRWLDMLSCRSFAASFPISSTIWLIRVIEGSM